MKKLILIFFASMTLFNLVSALIVNLNAPEFFNAGEKTYFNYSIISEIRQNITFISHINCPTAPIGIQVQKTTNLEAGQVFQETYSGITITDDIEPQECVAYVRILSPENLRQTANKSFKIETKPGFDLEIILNKKVFVKNEEININYISSVKPVEINATLIYPDGKKQAITLPITLKLEQVGAYKLEVIASKEGYKETREISEFAVIGQKSEIGSGFICNVNGKCEGGENWKNCPQDCKSGEGNVSNNNFLKPIIIFILIVAGIFVLYWVCLSIRKKVSERRNLIKENH